MYKPILKSIYPSPPETTSILNEADLFGLLVWSKDFARFADEKSVFAPSIQDKIKWNGDQNY